MTDPEKPQPNMAEVGEDDESDLGMGSGEVVGDGRGGENQARSEDALAAFMRKKGLRDVNDLISHAEANERKVSELGGQLRTVMATPPMMPMGMNQAEEELEKPVWPEDPYDLMDKEKYKKFQADMDRVIERRVERGVERAQSVGEQRKMLAKAIAKREQNPTEFERLRPRMIEISKQPENTYASLDELYEKAKQAERAERSGMADEIVKEIFGPDADLTKIRATIPKMQRPPEISRSGGGGSPSVGAPTDRQMAEKAIRDNILNAKRLES